MTSPSSAPLSPDARHSSIGAWSGKEPVAQHTHVEAAPAPRKKQRRGFAAMSAEKQRTIASLGGKAAHAKGTAHEFSPEEAREAGRKGGQAAQRARSDGATSR